MMMVTACYLYHGFLHLSSVGGRSERNFPDGAMLDIDAVSWISMTCRWSFNTLFALSLCANILAPSEITFLTANIDVLSMMIARSMTLTFGCGECRMPKQSLLRRHHPKDAMLMQVDRSD